MRHHEDTLTTIASDLSKILLVIMFGWVCLQCRERLGFSSRLFLKTLTPSWGSLNHLPAFPYPFFSLSTESHDPVTLGQGENRLALSMTMWYPW